MGRVFLTLLVLGLIWWGITSTFFRIYTDPFGMTTREEVRSYTAVETTRLETEAAVNIAQTQAQAAVEIASTQAYAQIESTRLLADAAIEQAREERKQTEAWTDVLPLLLLILSGGGAVWLLIMYQGRLLLVLADRGITVTHWLAQAPTGRLPEAQTQSFKQPFAQTRKYDPEAELARYAQENDLSIRRENGYYLLIDNSTNEVVKQLVAKDW
jgi:hypothetical protein